MHGRKSAVGPTDPAARVRAPVDAALGLVVWRCTFMFALCVVSIAAPILLHLSEDPTLLIRHSVPAFLTIDILVHAWRWFRWQRHSEPGQPSPLEQAWAIDPEGTRLAICMIAIAAVSVLGALGALVFPYLTEPDARAVVVSICFPVGGAISFLAGIAWAQEIGRLLTRAVDDSNAQFRSYWANVGHDSHRA